MSKGGIVVLTHMRGLLLLHLLIGFSQDLHSGRGIAVHASLVKANRVLWAAELISNRYENKKFFNFGCNVNECLEL